MRKLILYIQESYKELLYKVTWPSWKEVQGSSILVMVSSLIIALVVAAMDLIFKNMMEGIYGLFS